MKLYMIIIAISLPCLLAQFEQSPTLHGPPIGIAEQPTPEELNPYSFAWTASRHHNGIPDREHREERGQDGVTRGVFRYIDPRRQIQEVIYVSDKFGFHVQASNLPQDTKVVKAAKKRHQTMFEKIAAEHARIGLERAQMEAAQV